MTRILRSRSITDEFNIKEEGRWGGAFSQRRAEEPEMDRRLQQRTVSIIPASRTEAGEQA